MTETEQIASSPQTEISVARATFTSEIADNGRAHPAMRCPGPDSTESGVPKVYSYTRWSTIEQANGDTRRRQLESARQWAVARGYDFDQAHCIADAGRSAYRGGNALDGGLSRFLAACRIGLVARGSFLLVESLDRISRMAPRRAQRLIDEIVDAGVTIVTLSDNQSYTAERLDGDPTALLLALLVSWRAHEESRTKACRVAAAWAEKRRRLRANPRELFTRRAPSWLCLDEHGQWIEIRAKSEVVRRIYAMARSGIGEHRIANTLNQDGVPTLGKGVRWHRSTVAKLLRNPAVIGALTPGRMEYIDGERRRVLEAPIPDAFPGTVPIEDWDAVRALKDAPSGRRRHVGNRVRHYLAGLAACPKCGSSMYRINKGSSPKCGRPKLVCAAARARAGCPYVSVSVDKVESAVNLSWPILFESSPHPERRFGLDCEQCPDVVLANRILKLEFQSVVVDYTNNTLRFQRRTGGERIIRYA